MRRTLMPLLFLLAPVLAAEPKVGEDAPRFKAGGNIVNPPEFARELPDCQGNVVLIMEWHARDASAKDAAKVQAYWDKYSGRGLHVFTIFRLDFEKLLQVRKLAKSSKYTFPICMGGFYDEANDFARYKADSGFRTTVINIEGKVAFWGNAGWEAVLDRELARCPYGSLPREKVADPAKEAAKAFGDRKFGRALKQAERLLAAPPDDQTKADLELICTKARELAEKRNERIKAWRADLRYDLVMPALDTMKDEFAEHELGEAAKKELFEIRKDKAAKDEIRAFDDLKKLVERSESQGDEMLVNALKAFAREQNTVRAGRLATEMAKQLEAEIEETRKK
ncbi:MAG: hypothetical protein IT463_11910 [Planctomycetes bacterium]|nr:hypothetical protein [Planctomycetota bacterium]